MATATGEPIDSDIDSRTATFERKRPYDIDAGDDTSNAGSPASTPRKRVRCTGKLAYQDVRDFVPSGANFSSSAIFLEAETDGEIEGPQLVAPTKSEDMKDDSFCDVSEDSKSSNEGRRLFLGNLAYATTEEDLRAFFDGFVIENVTNPINPLTSRPTGYGFVEVATSAEADRAISQLDGKSLLERKVSVQRTRKTSSGGGSAGTAVFRKEATPNLSMPVDEDIGNFEPKETHEDPVQERGTILKQGIKQDFRDEVKQLGAPTKWNAVNTTKIRTSFGGSRSEDKANEIDEPVMKQEAQRGEEPHDRHQNQEVNEHEKRYETQQEKATRIALEKLEGLRQRLSGIEPHDGPVSAYKMAQQELRVAEVDYNYCLFYPLGQKFHKPPTSTTRNSERPQRATQEKRLKNWHLVERCMKDGILQDLHEGKIAEFSADSLKNAPSTQQSKADASYSEGQSRSGSSVTNLGNMDLRKQQLCDIEETARRMQCLTKSFRHMPIGGQLDEQMKSQIQEAKTDCNYCRYFPSNDTYIPLSLAKLILRGDRTSDNSIESTARKAARLWKVMEQCDRDRTLQDLKDGRLDAWMQEVLLPTQPFASSAVQVPYSDHRNHRGRKRNRASKYSNRRNDPIIEAQKAITEVVEASNTDIVAKSDKSTAELSTTPNVITQDHRNNSMGHGDNLQVGIGTMPKYGDERTPDTREDQEQFTQEEDAIINITTNSEAGSSEFEKGNSSQRDSSDLGSESLSEDGDAIMGYANSEQVTSGAQHQTGPFFPNRNARILAELSSQDLNAQLRYFHITKTPQEVDLNTPVRCLVCAQYGHMAGICESLSCTACGSYNQHLSQNCPKSAKCEKCRELGHDKQHCPYKLKNIAKSEILCDLCQRSGHAEKDCELLWRTSGRPWEFDLSHSNVRLSCYECGQSRHLGNDCPTRKPGKPMGTSTWGPGRNHMSTKAKGELSIKGRAQEPILLNDSDDELAAFHRPKVHEPARKLQIRINTAAKKPGVKQQPYSGWTPINGPYKDSRAPETTYQSHQDDGRENWLAATRLGTEDNYYRPGDRRSVSPQYRDHGRNFRSEKYEHPVPRGERRPARDGELYRPMPSSGRYAWRQHRV